MEASYASSDVIQPAAAVSRYMSMNNVLGYSTLFTTQL